MPANADQAAVYRIWSGDKLLFTGESLFVFSRAYVNVRKSHWFPLPTHITIEWCGSKELAVQAKEQSVQEEKPLFCSDDGGSYLLTDGRYVNTTGLTQKAQQSRPVPDGYYRDANGTLHSKRERSRGRGRSRGFVPASERGKPVSAQEEEDLRRRVRKLEARLAQLDVCITPGCRRKITALAEKMCEQCYNRAYHQDRRRGALLAKHPEVYQAWVMRCILEDLAAAPGKE